MKTQLLKFVEITRFSAGISLALHILFLWGVGNLFISKQLPPPPKSIKIKFMTPKPPPTPEIKKEEIKEEAKKIVKIEPQALPKPIVKKVEPVPAQYSTPKVPEPLPVAATASQPVNAITTARVTTPDSLPKARVLPATEPAQHGENKGTASLVQSSAHVTRPDSLPKTRALLVSEPAQHGENKGTASLVQSTARRLEPSPLTPRTIQSFASDVGRGNERVATIASPAGKKALPVETARPVPSVTESKSTPDPQVLKGYLGTIQSKIERTKEYPDAARRAGNQGRVKVQFTILKDGRIENAILIDKTPHNILNEEALAAVNRAAPFERLPDELGKDSLSVILPFSFLLN